jgi:multidrug resistance protein MdtO
MMAAAAQTAPAWPSRVTWLRNFLREELAPYPGRGVLMARILVATTIVMVLIMTFQIPFGAVAVYFAMLISRESPEATIKAAKIMSLGFAAGAAQVLLGAMFFSGEPLVRLAWATFSFFLMFYLLSAMSNYAAALQFGVLISVTTPIWDEHVSAESRVETTLWAVGAIALSTVVTAVIELIYARLQPHDANTVSLSRRLRGTAVLLRSWADGVRDQKAERYVTRFSILGTSLMRRDLQRASYSPAFKQRMGAVVALVGRLVDLAASVPEVASYTVAAPESEDRERLLRLASTLDLVADHLLRRASLLPALPAPGSVSAGSIPLLAEMEGTTDLIVEVLCGTQMPNFPVPASMESESTQQKFFLPDAFSDPRHLRFAIRGGLATLACYVIYSLADWPGISTALVTCFITALTTIGASRQKQVLRFAGTFVGGFLFGFGAQILILPGIDSITGFALVVAAVTVIACWFATAGPRLSYFGLQIALSFYFINLQEFRFQTSLSIARDRVVGVLLGLVMMWLIFDQLWGAPSVIAMQRAFISGIRSLARLMREPVSPDLRLALDQTLKLRETLYSTFENMRQQADGVTVEFGSSHERDMALRTRTLAWSLQLRIVFLARNTLLQYRLRLPGFELPPDKLEAQKDFDDGVATILDSLADRLEGRPQKPEVPDPHALFEQLETALRQPSPSETHAEVAIRRQTIVPLTQRIVGVLATVREQVESSVVTSGV